MIFLAIISALLSAICMAIVVVTDRLMVGDCYRGKPMHAWFVSSLAGSVFGIILTALIWIGFGFLSFGVDLSTLFSIAKSLFVWKGIATLLLGALGSQLMLHYFRCFSENANATVMASWIASTPLFVFMVMLFITLFFNTEGLITTSTHPIWMLGVLLATTGLIAFEYLSGEPSGDTRIYRKELIILITLNTLYAVALKQVLSIEVGNTTTLIEAVALMPFYWLGFAVGTRGILRKGEWASFRAHWHNRIKLFIVPILFLEVVGMLAYFFEYMSLITLDPAVVTIIIGAHILVVYLCDVLLGWYRTQMIQHNINEKYVLGIRLIQNKLPEAEHNVHKVVAKIMVMFIIIFGIAIVVQFI